MRAIEFTAPEAQKRQAHPVKALPSQEVLQSLFYFDCFRGCLVWRRGTAGYRRGERAAGAIGVVKGEYKYRIIEIAGTVYAAHRLIWKFHCPENIDDLMIDHGDGDTLNNRLDNLRPVTPKKNQRNKRRPRHNTSGVIGVGWHAENGKWLARIGCKHIGFYSDFSDAVAARLAAEIEHNFHENHGRIAAPSTPARKEFA